MLYYRVLRAGERNPVFEAFYKSPDDAEKFARLQLDRTTGTYRLEHEHRGKWFPVREFVIGDEGGE